MWLALPGLTAGQGTVERIFPIKTHSCGYYGDCSLCPQVVNCN